MYKRTILKHCAVGQNFGTLVCVTTVILLGAFGFGNAQSFVAFVPAVDFEFTEHSSLEKTSADKLAGQGAVIVNMADYPATFVSSSDIGQCTATIVGPDSVIIAAHCVDNGAEIEIAGTTAACSHSAKYNPLTRYGKTADYALCLLDSAISVRTFETLKLSSDQLFGGSFLLLSGMGCTTKNPPTYDHTLREGYAKILALPTGSTNDIVLGWDDVYSGNSQGAALCSGDSGGAAYFVPNLRDTSIRYVIAVNSRSAMTCVYGTNEEGRCIDDYAVIEGRSFVSSLTTDDAHEFVEEWVIEHDAEICGWNFTDASCRGG